MGVPEKGVVHVNMKLPKELIKSVDTFARDESRKTGVAYTRTDAVRRLLTLALEGLKNAKERSK